MRNAVNIFVIATWLLIQSISIVHSYGHKIIYENAAAGAFHAAPTYVSNGHSPEHAGHKHVLRTDLAQTGSDVANSGDRSDLSQLCDDPQCKSGELLLTHAHLSVPRTSQALASLKSRLVSWSPGFSTPPPNILA